MNRKGFFLKERETAETFLERIKDQLASDEALQEIPSSLKERLDLSPAWVSIEKKRIPFWCGAYVELYANGQAKVTLPVKRCWGPSEEELLSHELIHVARASMESKEYEEMLAHTLCTQKWRQKMANVLSSSFLRWIFLFCVLGQVLYQLLGGIFALPFIGDLLFPLVLLSILMIDAVSSYRSWSKFSAVRNKLSTLIGSRSAQSLMIRLTDAEINQFNSHSIEAIYYYFSLDVDLRRRVLFAMYFKKNAYVEKHCQYSAHTGT